MIDRRDHGARLACAWMAALALAPPLAAQQLVDPDVGTLEVVTSTSAQRAALDRIDGLEFDRFGNLFGVLEDSSGGVVHVDKVTGDVTFLVGGIIDADQISLHPSGDFFVSSEDKPERTTDRVYRVTVPYGPGPRPLASGAVATSLTTSLPIYNPEGLVVLERDGPFGKKGDVYVCEHADPGNVYHIDPATGQTTVLAGGFDGAEGMDLGDFGGAVSPALYFAETNAGRVTRLDENGVGSLVGDPTVVGLEKPDNVRFGPDGFLYVSEDRSGPDSRIIRIAGDGTHTVFATGFDAVQGMIFDPANGDMYISEQSQARIWRVRFKRPEGYLLVGTSSGSDTFEGEGHTWTTQISGLTSSHRVWNGFPRSRGVPSNEGPAPRRVRAPWANLQPTFPIPTYPTGRFFRHVPVPVGELFVQVVLWDKDWSAGSPEKWSKGMRVTLLSDGRVLTDRYGTRSEISIGAKVFEKSGRSYVRFPFWID